MSRAAPIDQGVTWRLPYLDGLRLMRARYVQHAFKPHAHDYFVLGLIEAGRQSFTHERDHHITTAGALIIINPGEVHTGEAAIRDGFAYRALYPSADLLRTIARELKPARRVGVPRFPNVVLNDPHVFGWIQRLHRLSEGAASALELEEQFTAFFAGLIRRHAADGFAAPDYQGTNHIVRQVRDYLEAHYADNITLTDLSQMAHITPYHLARTFSRQVGVPPHRYLENVRIRHVERLLLAGMPIADVAYATGFSSQSHLTRTFKRFIGTTPGQFLKQRKIV
jgi:AraC-like DNA-binding protein